MDIPKTFLDGTKKIESPKEPQKKPEKVKVVYVSVPKEYVDDPYLTIKQVMAITQWGKTKAGRRVRTEMKHIWDGGNLRVRQSWLNKWFEDHTEEPFK